MGVGQIMLLNGRKARALAAMQTADFVVGFCLRILCRHKRGSRARAYCNEDDEMMWMWSVQTILIIAALRLSIARGRPLSQRTIWEILIANGTSGAVAVLHG